MVTSVPSGSSIFIIDTEQYAGSFGANLCAYVTGRVAEDGKGESYATLYTQETGAHPIDSVTNVSDEENLLTPFSIWPTPGWFNNGAGGNYIVGQEPEAIAHYKKFRLQEISNLIRQKELIIADLDSGKVANLTKEQVQQEIDRHNQELVATRDANQIPVYPAYLSVAIFFHSLPSEFVLDSIKFRAFQFVETFKELDPNRRTINIRNFRFMHIQAQKRFPQCVAC